MIAVVGTAAVAFSVSVMLCSTTSGCSESAISAECCRTTSPTTHDDRTHLGLAKATPAERPMEPRLDDGGANVVKQLRVGGLHHRYAWPSAA